MSDRKMVDLGTDGPNVRGKNDDWQMTDRLWGRKSINGELTSRIAFRKRSGLMKS